MKRQAFMQALKRGLSGLPQSEIQEILADYETHFAEGVGAGRSEEEVAAALGDPARLARELKAEAGFRRWKEEPTPSSAAGLVLAVMGLATIDIFILIPVVIAIGSVIFAAFMAALGLFVGGAAGLVAAIFGHAETFGPWAGAFACLGLMSLAVALGSVLIPLVAWLLDLLGRYARLHFRLLQPLQSKTEDNP
jgi:uncharacterized membrane protein